MVREMKAIEDSFQNAVWQEAWQGEQNHKMSYGSLDLATAAQLFPSEQVWV